MKLKKKISILESKNSFEISLKQLANILKVLKTINNINFEFNNKIIKHLYSTYLSYVPNNKISSTLKLYSDDRGNFIELSKINIQVEFHFLQ